VHSCRRKNGGFDTAGCGVGSAASDRRPRSGYATPWRHPVKPRALKTDASCAMGITSRAPDQPFDSAERATYREHGTRLARSAGRETA
jgi:hypothetical protein